MKDYLLRPAHCRTLEDAR